MGLQTPHGGAPLPAPCSPTALHVEELHGPSSAALPGGAGGLHAAPSPGERPREEPGQEAARPGAQRRRRSALLEAGAGSAVPGGPGSSRRAGSARRAPRALKEAALPPRPGAASRACPLV